MLPIAVGRLVHRFPVHARAWLWNWSSSLLQSLWNTAKVCLDLLGQSFTWPTHTLRQKKHWIVRDWGGYEERRNGGRNPYQVKDSLYRNHHGEVWGSALSHLYHSLLLGGETNRNVLLLEMSPMDESFLSLLCRCQTCPNTCLQDLSFQQWLHNLQMSRTKTK